MSRSRVSGRRVKQVHSAQTTEARHPGNKLFLLKLGPALGGVSVVEVLAGRSNDLVLYLDPTRLSFDLCTLMA